MSRSVSAAQRLAYPELVLQLAHGPVGPDGRETSPVINPVDESVLGLLPHASYDDLGAALAATGPAWTEWRARSAWERAGVLRTAADLLRARLEEIAVTTTLENGKTLNESRGEVLGSADTLDWLADESRRAYGRVVPSRFPDGRSMVLREPVGPVAAFTPWNAPALTVMRKVGSALAAGCSIILKAAEETPGTALHIHRAFMDAGVPRGAFQLVFGDPGFISRTLIDSPVIRKVTFTGSVRVGRLLASLAAASLKRVTLELGGHAPVIVCEDADVDLAVREMADFKFRHSGQVCAAPSRFFIHRSRYEEFLAGFVAAAGRVVVGDGAASGTTMGPLTARRRLDAMEAFVADARSRGGRVVIGGERIGETGFFFPPTVIADVTDEFAVMRGEIFGPIAPMGVFDEVDEAIARANATDLGLTAFTFTESERTGRKLMNAVEAGLVTLNTGGTSLPELPFGGVKQSGYGMEGGTEGLEAYEIRKLVNNY